MRPHLISGNCFCDFCGRLIEDEVIEKNSQIFAFFFCTLECKKKWDTVKTGSVYTRYDPDISEEDAIIRNDEFAGGEIAAGHTPEMDNAGINNGQLKNAGANTERIPNSDSSGSGRKYLGLYFSLRHRGTSG